MARVSIGVPVYNGVSLIQESLDCIASQSFRDIEVIISDNGSTDGTSKICAEFVAKDSRFKHIRHDKVMDVMLNFAFVRDQAKSPLFMWRAYDDLSSHNYIEELVKVFDQAPETLLAVGNVSQELVEKSAKRCILTMQATMVRGSCVFLVSCFAAMLVGFMDYGVMLPVWKSQPRYTASIPIHGLQTI